MWIALIFSASFLSVTIFALLRGGLVERTGSLAVICASVASVPSEAFFETPEMGILAVDCALLAVFIYLMLRTDRFWPIWATAFQLVSVATHCAVIVQRDIVPPAYATFGMFWAYPVLASLAWGTFHYHSAKSNPNV